MEKTIKGDVRQTFFRSRQCLKPRLNGIMNVYSRQCRSVLSVCRLGSGCVRIQRRGRTEMARSRMLLLLAGVMPCVVLVEHGWSCSPRCKDVFLLESLHRCVPVRSLFTVCRCHPPCARIWYTVEASNFHPLRNISNETCIAFWMSKLSPRVRLQRSTDAMLKLSVARRDQRSDAFLKYN
jgi:hypothetical protein